MSSATFPPCRNSSRRKALRRWIMCSFLPLWTGKSNSLKMYSRISSNVTFVLKINTVLVF